MRDRMVDSLKSKEEPNTVLATENEDSSGRTRTFSMHFVNALFYSDEDHNKSKEESPSCDRSSEKVLTETLEIKGSVASKPRIEDDEEIFKDVRKLPQERKISLLVSIFDKLVGSSDDQNQHLPTVPERTKEIEVTIGSDTERNCAEVSSTSSGNGDCTSFNEEEIRQTSFENNKDNKEGSAPIVTISAENEGFDCNEAGLTPCQSPVSITARNTAEKTNDSEIRSASLESDSVENGGKPVQEIMTVRAWLKNPHLYKVIGILTLHFSK